MNGKQMLEAMSFVDEAYIADAEMPPKHLFAHWKRYAAAAACLAVVLAGVWNLRAMQEAAPQGADMAAYSAEEDMPMSNAMCKAAAPVTATLIQEMTVLVVKQEGNALRCQVEEPGTGSFEVGQEITVLLPDDFQDTLSGRLLVSFSPTDDAGIVTALDWTQLED